MTLCPMMSTTKEKAECTKDCRLYLKKDDGYLIPIRKTPFEGCRLELDTSYLNVMQMLNFRQQRDISTIQKDIAELKQATNAISAKTGRLRNSRYACDPHLTL
jgi:hypothetical protein